MSKTLGQMADEIREVNVAKGWRPAEGGPGDSTWGDYWALVNTELGEMTEAYRDHRLADATNVYDCVPEGCYGKADCADGHDASALPKPEGVGSEMADVLIRVLDTADVFGVRIERDLELGDLADLPAIGADSFGGHVAWLHWKAGQVWIGSDFGGVAPVVHLLRALVTVARDYQIDLDAEYERKIAYNRTRGFQHGGRTITGETPASRLARLKAAMPTDPREWWTGEEADVFVDKWSLLKLPTLTLGDDQGDHYLFWCVDPGRAAEMIGVNLANDGSFTIENGCGYSVSIVLTIDEKETNDGGA
jgi:NTP pyrophosphatase (non-canonical NTP hydrolase)